MMLDDVIEIKTADPDSQYRPVPCKCSSDNVAYVHYNGRGGAKWRVTCFDCGHTVDKGCRVRHDAQLAWNGLVQAERYRRTRADAGIGYQRLARFAVHHKSLVEAKEDGK